MTKIGLILACQHYPAVTSNPSDIDAQLRRWLREYGISITEIEVFAAFDGEFPRHAASCDVWIISGMPLSINGPTNDQAGNLRQFLRAAAALGRAIYCVNHAEHAAHAALAAIDAQPPKTSAQLRSIRNPFRSFHSRDTLHRFNPQTRQIESLPRPEAITRKGMFGALRIAA